MSVLDDLDKDLYVIVAETECVELPGRPIVWETYLDGRSASLEVARMRRASIGAAYGETRIAKLVFIEDEAVNKETEKR